MTIAQSAVFAALAARGPSTLTEIVMAVGARTLSEAERVLEALARQRLVRGGGDPALVYADGAMFSLAGQEPPMKCCVECEVDRPHRHDDYLCIVCRAEMDIAATRAA
jgi:hypothetical protein